MSQLDDNLFELRRTVDARIAAVARLNTARQNNEPGVTKSFMLAGDPAESALIEQAPAAGLARPFMFEGSSADPFSDMLVIDAEQHVQTSQLPVAYSRPDIFGRILSYFRS